MLLQRDEYNERWREYLLEAARANRPWNQLFRETMLPEEYAANDTRPVAFLKRRTNDLDAMTNDSSTLWFGVNISCAKCHDHPLVDDWKQAHYYGMAAFFKRTFQTRKGHLGERFEGQPKIYGHQRPRAPSRIDVLDRSEDRSASVEAEGDELKKLQEQIKKAEQDERPTIRHVPSFVPARNWSNWRSRKATNGTLRGTWPIACGRASFGRGLVHPLDQMHSHNPPSHPELLEDLTADLIQSEYDMRRMIHALVSTDSYARSIRHADASSLAPEWFAVTIPRALTPRQLAISLRVAGSSPDKMTGISSEDWSSKREQLEKQADGLARQLTIPDEDFQVPVTEALWFSNNPWIEKDLFNNAQDRLIGHLKQMPEHEQVVRAATLSVLSREPTQKNAMH